MIIFASALLLALCLPVLIKISLPFIIATIIARILQTPVKKLEKLKIKRGLSSFAFIIILLSSFISLITIVCYKIFVELAVLFNDFPRKMSEFNIQLNALFSKYLTFYNGLSRETRQSFDIILETLNTGIKGLVSKITVHFTGIVTQMASFIPDLILLILITLLAAFFITKDYNKIIKFIKNSIPPSAYKNFQKLKSSLLGVLFSYMKSVLVLMFISTCEVAVGLSILRVRYALVIALITGIVDALPIFGTGVILIPLIVFYLIRRNLYMAICVLIIQIICFLVRQILEPKIISHQVGVHPLVTIISVYVGAKLLGAGGVIILPIVSFVTLSVIEVYKDEIFVKTIDELNVIDA